VTGWSLQYAFPLLPLADCCYHLFPSVSLHTRLAVSTTNCSSAWSHVVASRRLKHRPLFHLELPGLTLRTSLAAAPFAFARIACQLTFSCVTTRHTTQAQEPFPVSVRSAFRIAFQFGVFHIERSTLPTQTPTSNLIQHLCRPSPRAIEFNMADITANDQTNSPTAPDDLDNGNGALESRGVKRPRPSAADDDDDDDDKPGRERRKIDIKFIQDKSRRHITFSKRKAGIMKKVSQFCAMRPRAKSTLRPRLTRWDGG